MAYTFNTITFSWGASKVFDAYVSEVVEQYKMEEIEDLKQKMWFVNVKALHPDQKFATTYWVKGLDVLGEWETKKELDLNGWEKKGFSIVEYGNKITTTHLFTKWAKSSNNIKGAPESIQAMLYDISNSTKSLMQAWERTYMEEMVKLRVKGFSITASAWVGSATPKGKALFTTDHTVSLITGATQSNKVGTNLALSATNLQTAIDQLKGMKLDNGHRVPQPKKAPYKLFVSPVKAVVARQVLNTPGSMAGIFSGSTTNTNANVFNQFNFNGNFVEIVELDILGTYDKNDALIGTDDYWFVTNPRYLDEAKSFKFIEIANYPITAKTYMSDDTDNEVADIRMWFAVDHYGAEYGIVWSTWAWS